MHRSIHDSITATELARNVAQSIDRVRLSGVALSITKGTQTIAELCPPPKPGLPIAKLAELLCLLPKLDADAAVMHQDMNHIRSRAKLLENPWG